jgi:hypothetical protein
LKTSRRKSEIAVRHAEKLPAFSSLEEAQHQLYTYRDKQLALLAEIAKHTTRFQPDYSPESLKQLEQWYYQLYETGSFQLLGLTRETFETCMAMYFGETAVRTAGAHWIVEEYFLAPGRYELGLQKESVTMMLLQHCLDHFQTPNNKRRQSLFRDYRKYFSKTRR